MDNNNKTIKGIEPTGGNKTRKGVGLGTYKPELNNPANTSTDGDSNKNSQDGKPTKPNK